MFIIENIGIYEKIKCVGRGTTGRVCIFALNFCIIGV